MPRPPLAALRRTGSIRLDRIPLAVLERWLARTTADARSGAAVPAIRDRALRPQPDVCRPRLSGPRALLAERPAEPDPRSPRLQLRGEGHSGSRDRNDVRPAANGLLYAIGPRGTWRPAKSAHVRTTTYTRCPTCSRRQDLVTLHIYSPPLLEMNMYSIVAHASLTSSSIPSTTSSSAARGFDRGSGIVRSGRRS